MTLVDLCEIYAIKTGAGSNYAAIFADSEIDPRIGVVPFFNLLCQKFGNCEPIFNTTEVFKLFSDAWFNRNNDTIKRMLDALAMEYNPIENYDRTETIERNRGNTGKVNGTTNNTNSVAAYNVSVFSNNTQDSGNNNMTSSGEEHEGITNKRHGNIGVTTSQQMLTAELELRQFQIIEWVVEKWSNELLSSVY